MEFTFASIIVLVMFYFVFKSWFKKLIKLGDNLLDKANEAVENWDVESDD